MSNPPKTYISNKLFIAFLLITAASLGFLQFKQWQKRQAIEREVATLTRDAQNLEERNKQISDSLDFLHSTSAKERIARGQLNMKKDGEIVVNFGEPQVISAEAPTSEQNESNPKKWWNYFFNDTK